MGVKYSLSLKEEHEVENRMLRRIYKPRRCSVMEELRELYNEELDSLFS
jgi:hypothetical protein